MGCLVLSESLGPSLCSGVSTTPGATALKRIPSFAYSIARFRGHGIQASLGHHRNRSIYAGEGLIRKRRGDAHNVSRFLFQHLLYGELGNIEKSQEVRRDQGIEVLGSEVRKRLGALDSGVIHQRIDGSEVLDRCFDSFGSGLLLTNVAIHQNQVG
jgi:hypothetical protein